MPVNQMRCHYPVTVTGSKQPAIGLQFDRLPAICCIDKAEMGIAAGTPVTGKMLEAAAYTVTVMSFDKGSGVGDNFCWIGAKTALIAADDRIVLVKVEIDHWSKIEVNAAVCQFRSHNRSVTGCGGYALSGQFGSAAGGGRNRPFP